MSIQENVSSFSPSLANVETKYKSEQKKKKKRKKEEIFRPKKLQIPGFAGNQRRFTFRKQKAYTEEKPVAGDMGQEGKGQD